MLFRKDIEPRCSYCRRGKTLSASEVSCIRRGVTPASSSCRRFVYDPLKRIPPKPVKLNLKGLTDEDFKIE